MGTLHASAHKVRCDSTTCTRIGTMMRKELRHGNWGEFVRMYVTERDRDSQSSIHSHVILDAIILISA